MRYVFVFILASWLSNKNITGLWRNNFSGHISYSSIIFFLLFASEFFLREFVRGVFVLAFRCKIIIRSRKGEGMDEVGVKVWVFVATIFFSPKHSNITKIQKNWKKTHQVFKKITRRTSKDPRQKITLMYHIFLPAPRQTERGWIHPSSPPLRPLNSSFVPTPPLGGTWPPSYFYPVDKGYPSGVTSHSKK